MKLIGTERDQLLLQFGKREKDLFLRILSLYPSVPTAYHKLTRSGKVDPSNQELLDEALAEHRAENQKQLAGSLAQPARWTENDSGWRLALGVGEAEWLLQVLNDIRVGSWVRLGCPEQEMEVFDETTAPHFWALEIAGLFETALLRALGPQSQ